MIVGFQSLQDFITELEEVELVVDKLVRFQIEYTPISELAREVAVRATALVAEQETQAFLIEYGQQLGREVISEAPCTQSAERMRVLLQDFCDHAKQKLTLRKGVITL